MNDRELENRIRASYENIAPDIRESILSDCEAQKGQVIIMQKTEKKILCHHLVLFMEY